MCLLLDYVAVSKPAMEGPRSVSEGGSRGEFTIPDEGVEGIWFVGPCYSVVMYFADTKAESGWEYTAGGLRYVRHNLGNFWNREMWHASDFIQKMKAKED